MTDLDPLHQSGAALANFTVAVSHRSKHNGEWQDVNDGLRPPSNRFLPTAISAAKNVFEGRRNFLKPVKQSDQYDYEDDREGEFAHGILHFWKWKRPGCSPSPRAQGGDP